VSIPRDYLGPGSKNGGEEGGEEGKEEGTHGGNSSLKTKEGSQEKGRLLVFFPYIIKNSEGVPLFQCYRYRVPELKQAGSVRSCFDRTSTVQGYSRQLPFLHVLTLILSLLGFEFNHMVPPLTLGILSLYMSNGLS
jgi:hypothetical protein